MRPPALLCQRGCSPPRRAAHLHGHDCAPIHGYRDRAAPAALAQVVSDIDDTLMSSGGHFPAGCDARLPRHCVYPGAVAFLNELDTGHVLRVRARARAHRACHARLQERRHASERARGRQRARAQAR